MNMFIKNFGIVFGSLFYYLNFTNHNLSKRKWKNLFLLGGTSIVISMLSVLVNHYNKYLTIFVMFCLMNIVASFIKNGEELMFLTLFSFSISCAIFTIAVVIVCLIALLTSIDFFELYGQISTMIIQLLLMCVPLRFQRTRKIGIPLKNRTEYSMLGMILSVCIIFLVGWMNDGKYDYIYMLPSMVIFILSILIFVYWRTSITRSYLERLGNRNIASLNEELLQKDEYIKKLEADVERLGKIVHRDNKLVPAMEMAVERFIMDESGEMSVGSELLEELRKMSKDRKGLVTASVNATEPGVNTGVAKVDNLITYMSEKASTVGISLKVTQGIDVKEMLEKNIDEESFCTLLADLLDNAIIATKYNNARDVLLDMSMIKKAPAIHIFDSGIPFDKEVLINYGIEQTTTHGDDGGSGIGLMQTYEILAKRRASIFIDEFSSGLYTKKISVVFDRKRQFLLYTPREDSEVSFLKRRADLTVVRK